MIYWTFFISTLSSLFSCFLFSMFRFYKTVYLMPDILLVLCLNVSNLIQFIKLVNFIFFLSQYFSLSLTRDKTEFQ
jgi:hypothetical protein